MQFGFKENEAARAISNTVEHTKHKYNLHPESISPEEDIVDKCVLWLRSHINGTEKLSPSISPSFKKGKFDGYKTEIKVGKTSHESVVPIHNLPVCQQTPNTRVLCAVCRQDMDLQLRKGTQTYTLSGMELKCGHAIHMACVPSHKVANNRLKKALVVELEYMW